jgi:hypothetical protein
VPQIASSKHSIGGVGFAPHWLHTPKARALIRRAFREGKPRLRRTT